MYRIGNGYDVHKLSQGEELVLGGIKIAHDKGTVGHSDGDVLLHAIIDALLGAAAMKDIGYWFPDSDMKLKGVDSKILLDKTVLMLSDNNYRIVNIDSTIAAQKPKLKPYVDTMRQKISEICGIDIENVSVKATTTENLGFEGREEGISAYSVVLICKNNNCDNNI